MKRLAALLFVALWAHPAAAEPRFASPVYAGTTIDVVTLDHGADLDLVWRDSRARNLTTLFAARTALEATGRKVLAVTNAGIFGVSSTGAYPLGVHIQAGLALRPLNTATGTGNFYLKPNGVFWLDTRRVGHVAEAGEFAAIDRKTVRLATQSGPLLLHGGTIHPAFRRDAPSRKIRSGIATCGGKVVLAVSRDGINFWDFATFFRDSLHCRDALYLDGSISRLYAPARGLHADAGPFAGMLVVSVPRK